MDFNHYAEQVRSNTIGFYADKKEHFKEINYISKIYGIPTHRIGILVDTADGEHWIMIDDRWCGDLDDWFYTSMEMNLNKNEYLTRNLEDII